MDSRTIIRLLKEARERADLTQQDVADAAGVGMETISRMERGANEPELSNMVAIARALGCELTLTGPNVPGSMREQDPPVPLVATQLAARATLLDSTAQKALLRLAQILPVKAPAQRKTKPRK